MKRKNKIANKIKPGTKRVLFYTSSSYGFRSWTIWYAYEVSQVYPVILLSEKLDPDTEAILKNKEFFPKLEEIVYVKHPSSSLKLMVKNNKALHREAKEVIEKYKPDIVITGGLVYPFPLYLRRIAERNGAINVCTFSPRIYTSKEISSYVKLMSAYSGKLKFMPFCISFFWESIRKQLGHFLYYWILPIMAGEKPFRDEPGCILFKGIKGRSADYYVSFLKQDYDNALMDGMPPEKLSYQPKIYPEGYNKVREFSRNRFAYKKTGRVLTIMWPHSRIGIKKEDHSLITEETLREQRIKVLCVITEMLANWKIIIKPHPDAKDEECQYIKDTFGGVSGNIEIINKTEWAEMYGSISDVVIGMPPVSSTLYNISLHSPNVIILSLDFEHELLGDGYKNFAGIKYIDSLEKFVQILKVIKHSF